MPELPEVETVRRTIAPRVTGRRIVSAEFRCLRVLRGGNPDEMSARLAGRRILGVGRRGKFLLIEIEGGQVLLVHLGMTGKLLAGGEPGRHTHAILMLDRGVLLYDDSRQFGCIELHDGVPARVARLGPEPLEIGFDEFAAALRKRRTRLKALLLDQRFLRGLGNIYADESLFRAGVHPLASAARLSRPRARRLYDAIVAVLTEAIAAGGSSISDYVDGDGRKGFFQVSHRVYQRTGEPCTACGTPIRRTLVAQRGTHYCPRCQRR
ncbi:MAG TPA: bifunctional DNA-formamidopyrimidine glycosylase/DNA-(apurinic or apyrimidinic site) lyase [Bryobacteraceae bacterium]|nr:bifunctional DNA-formamidopyrimidine glycosylase/DNA-(apurinic or apyrimidinic site) lyase [Bryobacteraceae bacterium]